MTESRGITAISERAWARRLLARLGEGPFPYAGQWELTCRCNLRCVMCYTDPFNTADRIKEELRYAEIVRILDELEEAGCLELCFTGGEPLARPDFLDIYASATERGFRLTLFTNGTLITSRIADQLAAWPPAMVEISFHGLTAGSFDGITRTPGSRERCLRGIRSLLERGLPVTLKSLGMTLNREEVLEIKAMTAGLGANVHYKFGAEMRPRLDGSADPFDLQLSEREIGAIEGADEQMREERKRLDEAERTGPKQCGGGRFSFHIDAYGRLGLCSNNRRRGYDLRAGSFREGFYEVLPRFPCPLRQGSAHR